MFCLFVLLCFCLELELGSRLGLGLGLVLLLGLALVLTVVYKGDVLSVFYLTRLINVSRVEEVVLF